MLKRPLWTLALLLLVACGEKASTSDDPGTDAGPRLDAGAMADAGPGPMRDAGASDAGDAAQEPAGDVALDYCTPLANLVCTRGSECGCGALVPGGTLDTAGCVARFTDTCLKAYAPYIQAVTAGKARVVKTAAQECISLIESLTPACEKPRGTVSLALCAPWVVSDAPVGADCADVPICAGGLGACSEGMCKARGKTGAACNSEFDCDTGLVCTPDGCRPLLAENATCSDDIVCAPPLRCISGSCEAPRAEGKVCEDSGQCAQGLVCDGMKCKPPVGTCDETTSCGARTTCGAVRTCQARTGVDGVCKSDTDCTSDLYCSSEGKCTSLPGLDQPCANGAACAAGFACDPSGAETPLCLALPAEGKPCGLTTDGPFACAAGLACVDGVCGPVPTSGQPCAQPNLCGPGLACDFTAEGSICVAPKPTGGACQNEVVCGPTGHCSGAGMCEADFAVGDRCNPNLSECAGACERDSTFGFSCVPPRGLGDTCIFDDECPDTMACRPKLDEASCIPEVCEVLN